MTQSPSLDRGLALLRLALGTIFIAHGGQKLLVFGLAGTTAFLESIGIPFPGLNAVVLTAVEVVGGAALLAGVFTRLTAVLLAFAMVVAVFAVHLPNGYFMPDGVEFALTLGLTSLALAQTGPGRYSVDARLERRPATAVISTGRQKLAA